MLKNDLGNKGKMQREKKEKSKENERFFEMQMKNANENANEKCKKMNMKKLLHKCICRSPPPTLPENVRHQNHE